MRPDSRSLALGIVVTIDGPAGAGKSTVAKALAKQLGWRYLDTGALYRAAALIAEERGIPTDDAEALGALTVSLQITQDPQGRTFVGDRDVSTDVRTEAVSDNASRVSAHPPVRSALVEVQRRIALAGDLVCEGRDMGTVIFPDAQLKVFLVANARTRAMRRGRDLEAQGEPLELEELVLKIEDRDRRDTSRATSPLEKQNDMIEIDTTDLSIEQVLERLQQLVSEQVER